MKRETASGFSLLLFLLAAFLMLAGETWLYLGWGLLSHGDFAAFTWFGIPGVLCVLLAVWIALRLHLAGLAQGNSEPANTPERRGKTCF